MSTTENRKELFLRACRLEPVPRVPVWIMRQAGRYLPEYRALRAKHSFLEICKTPELAIEVSLQPHRRLDVDAVIVFSDILIPAEAMGMALELTDDGPVLPNPIRNRVAVDALREFDPENETRFLMDAIRGLVCTLGSEIPILGFAAAPWTLAYYVVEGQTKSGCAATKQMLFAEPELMRALLEKIARITARYLSAQIAAGATAVQLFDTWAGELGLEEYREFALPATQQVISEIEGDTPVILFTKGSSHLLDAIAQAGADVLSVDWRIDLATARERLGYRIALQGNVDPCVLLATEESVREAARRAIEKTRGLGHILNLGHGILPSTPVENALAFVHAAKTTPLPAPVSLGSKAKV